MMTKMPRDLWKRIVDSGFVAIVTLLSFLSFFVWRLLTSESDVKSNQKVQIGCFTSPSIRGISEKQSFLVYFQLQYCSFETCGEFTGNIHMNSPQENSPWGIPLGESDSLPQANWWIHEECPGNQIHGEFPMVNSPWWILHWDSQGNSWWWIPHRKFPMVNSPRRIILGK